MAFFGGKYLDVAVLHEQQNALVVALMLLHRLPVCERLQTYLKRRVKLVNE